MERGENFRYGAYMKYRLLAPGPTPVSDRVLSVMSRNIIHHRTPAFEAIFEACREGLQWLMQTEDDVLVLSSSGTGGFEAAFQNFFNPGDAVICVGGGKFGDRWGLMSKALGLETITVDVEWGKAAKVEDVKVALGNHPNARAVVCVASETSTGVRHPYEAISALVKEREAISIVDGITAVGVWDVCPERDGIDVLVTGSQKALMLPPGLSVMSVSKKAWDQAESSTMPRYYFDLKKERKSQAKNQTAYTPPVSLMAGLQESLAMMQEEGLDALFARHKRMAAASRAGMEALNLQLFAEVPSDAVTSVWNPEGMRDNGVYAGLRDRANLTIAGGQDHLKGKIFRLAHLGYFDEMDIYSILCAVETVLRQEGYTDFSPGASVAAAMPILSEGFGASGTLG